MRLLTPSVQFLLIVALIASWMNIRAQESQFSEANNLLFNRDHLGNISADSRLNYHFIKSGSLEPGFEDDIKMSFKPAASVEKRTVTVDFFSGERNRWVPDFNGARGNPLLTIFLQHDIHEMSRLTDGKWRYFQKRIKLAFENNSTIEPAVFEFSGKEYQGKKITIYPYKDDPNSSRFKDYVEKYYVFTLADNLPGTIYQIRTITPDAGKKSDLLIETVTLTSISD